MLNLVYLEQRQDDFESFALDRREVHVLQGVRVEFGCGDKLQEMIVGLRLAHQALFQVLPLELAEVEHFVDLHNEKRHTLVLVDHAIQN